MGFNQIKKFSKIVLIFCTILLCLSFCLQASAMRPLFEEQWLQKNPIKIQSLRKGPVPSRGGNPCTYIPGRGRGRCTLTQMNFAATATAHATQPAFPDIVEKFAAASADDDYNNKTHKHDSSS